MPKKFKDVMQLAFDLPAVYDEPAQPKTEPLNEAILSVMLSGNLSMLPEIDFTKGRITVEPNQKWKCWNAEGKEIEVVNYHKKLVMVVEPSKSNGGESV